MPNLYSQLSDGREELAKPLVEGLRLFPGDEVTAGVELPVVHLCIKPPHLLVVVGLYATVLGAYHKSRNGKRFPSVPIAVLDEVRHSATRHIVGRVGHSGEGVVGYLLRCGRAGQRVDEVGDVLPNIAATETCGKALHSLFVEGCGDSVFGIETIDTIDVAEGCHRNVAPAGSPQAHGRAETVAH